jgi:hypothetical protein
MSSNLYNISNELLELRDQLETENEFADESPEREWIENNLEIKEDELDTKLEGCIHVINQAEAQAAGALKEIARIQKFVIKSNTLPKGFKALYYRLYYCSEKRVQLVSRN